MKLINQPNRIQGFSLIEVLVSLSIFTIVVTICVSTLYTLIEANARSRNAQSISTNLSFTVDSLIREVRTGGDYFCSDNYRNLPVSGNATADCIAGEGRAFSFNEGGRSLTGSTPNNSRRIAYRLFDGKLQRRLGNGDGVSDVNTASDWLDLTSEDVFINTLVFHVEGSSRADSLAPIVTVYVSGEVGDETRNRSDFSLQTTITQRLLDI